MEKAKFGWFLIGLGALLLLKGGLGFIFLPLLFFWPVFLLPFVFKLSRRAHHGWHGHHGDWHQHCHGCGSPERNAPRDEVHERDDDEPRPNTGDTIRL